ncbi:MAG: tetratricopeptide repeat protein [Candidatus Obscuribacterales bacterium]|nr:tetratricopeptide repeat protein [Candidatus Obscuribacterales bacterium]
MIQMRRIALSLVACSLALGSSFACVGSALAQSTDPRAISMYNLGLNAYKQGSPESAIIFFKRATDIDPNLADAQYNLGVLFQSQRRYKEAVGRFLEVLRVKPNDCDAQYQLGVVNMGLGQYEEAKKYFNMIPPANVHFQEAQRKAADCDAKIASGVTTPTVIPTTAPTESLAASQMPQTNTAQPTATTSQPSYTAAATPTTTYQPATTNPPQTPQSVVGGGASGGSKPTPVLANSSVRVIATGFHAPSGLTFDSQGNLYVANFNSNSVDRISRDGTRSTFASGGHLKGPIGLAADDSGNLYVANYSGGTVARITPAGISTIIATDFKKPYYLTLDKGGNLFVSQQEDNSIIRITLPQSLTTQRPTPATP